MTLSPKFPSESSSRAFVKYISQEEIQGIVETLGNTLNSRYRGDEVYIIANLKGSFIFLADLVKNITEANLYFDFISVKSVGRTTQSPGSIIFSKDISHDLLGKKILVVEEIIDTGRALKFILDRIKLTKPESIEVVTLFDKPYKRAVDVKADYIGKKIDDHFIVGHGLDLEEFGRNLSDVYYLQYPN